MYGILTGISEKRPQRHHPHSHTLSADGRTGRLRRYGKKHLRPRTCRKNGESLERRRQKEDGARVKISTTEVWPPFFTNWRQNLQQDLSPESHSYAEKAVRYDASCWRSEEHTSELQSRPH